MLERNQRNVTNNNERLKEVWHNKSVYFLFSTTSHQG
jgi:hypothetical protein